jgi:hypothetical protein
MLRECGDRQNQQSGESNVNWFHIVLPAPTIIAAWIGCLFL